METFPCSLEKLNNDLLPNILPLVAYPVVGCPLPTDEHIRNKPVTHAAAVIAGAFVAMFEEDFCCSCSRCIWPTVILEAFGGPYSSPYKVTTLRTCFFRSTTFSSCFTTSMRCSGNAQCLSAFCSSSLVFNSFFLSYPALEDSGWHHEWVSFHSSTEKFK